VSPSTCLTRVISCAELSPREAILLECRVRAPPAKDGLGSHPQRAPFARVRRARLHGPGGIQRGGGRRAAALRHHVGRRQTPACGPRRPSGRAPSRSRLARADAPDGRVPLRSPASRVAAAVERGAAGAAGRVRRHRHGRRRGRGAVCCRVRPALRRRWAVQADGGYSLVHSSGANALCVCPRRAPRRSARIGEF